MPWVRRNVGWLAVIVLLLAIAIYPQVRDKGVYPMNFQYSTTSGVSSGMAKAVPESMGMARDSIGSMPPVYSPSAPTDTTNRLVVQDTQLSLVVNQVPEVSSQVTQLAQALGGYMVTSDVSIPEGASSGSVTIRVPVERRDEALSKIKSFGVRTLSESVQGQDVTDEYEDIDAKLTTINQTKAKFETLLDQTDKVDELLQIQQQIISLQSQIDSLKGRQLYLQQTAKLTRITVYLATDELALPYTPGQVWRPQVVFKQAVRDVISTLRQGANGLIKFGVYGIIWLPLLIIGSIVYKVLKVRSNARR